MANKHESHYKIIYWVIFVYHFVKSTHTPICQNLKLVQLAEFEIWHITSFHLWTTLLTSLLLKFTSVIVLRLRRFYILYLITICVIKVFINQSIYYNWTAQQMVVTNVNLTEGRIGRRAPLYSIQYKCNLVTIATLPFLHDEAVIWILDEADLKQPRETDNDIICFLIQTPLALRFVLALAA